MATNLRDWLFRLQKEPAESLEDLPAEDLASPELVKLGPHSPPTAARGAAAAPGAPAAAVGDGGSNGSALPLSSSSPLASNSPEKPAGQPDDQDSTAADEAPAAAAPAASGSGSWGDYLPTWLPSRAGGPQPNHQQHQQQQQDGPAALDRQPSATSWRAYLPTGDSLVPSIDGSSGGAVLGQWASAAQHGLVTAYHETAEQLGAAGSRLGAAGSTAVGASVLGAAVGGLVAGPLGAAGGAKAGAALVAAGAVGGVAVSKAIGRHQEGGSVEEHELQPTRLGNGGRELHPTTDSSVDAAAAAPPADGA